MSGRPRGGRRAVRTTSFPWWAATALAGAGAALVATVPQQPDIEVPVAKATAEPVSRTVLVCPPGIADAVVKVVAAVGTLDVAGSDDPAEVELAPRGTDVETVTLDRGALRLSRVGTDSVVLRAKGPSARGLVAVRGERAGSTLAGAGCSAPMPVWWFAGAGAGVDHSSVLFLSNTDEGPAVVDVRLHGATGSVDEAALRGITLGEDETVRLALEELAPGSAELAIEVRSSRGRVVAHLLDTVVDAARDTGSQGREWLAPTGSPAGDVVIPGIPAGADRVELLVANPGEDQALVDLQVVTADGAFVPLGTEQVSVDPGAIEKVDLTAELEGRSAAVRLRGPVPVSAAVRSWSGNDVAYAVPAAALDAPAGAVVVGNSSEVQLVGGDEPAVLRLVMHAADGREVLRRAVTVPPSGLVGVPVPRAAAHVVLDPSSGGGFAAVVHGGGGVASQPFTVLPATVLRPAVLPWDGQSPS